MVVLPDEVEVEVEVPRGGFLKWDGPRVEYVSPVPCPFNYGSVPGTLGPDGDPLDVVLLGPRRPRGHRERARVVGVVRFLDAGVPDDKLVCGAGSLRGVASFFRVYAWARAGLNRLRGLPGRTAFLGVEGREVLPRE